MIRLPERAPQASLLADLTPLLDVIFIILVFSLLTANTPLLSLPMQLPSSSDQAPAAVEAGERRQLLLRADDTWQLDGRSFTSLEQLRSAAELSGADRLDIAADRDASADGLVRLLAWLASVGLTDTRLLMDSDDE
ncbi:ExbD/TolR family protein [Pseudomonas sp.]|uniref:ExbD/TolR family protein n=1 Tax=Pseudomonas sp. TaxID=306 RepID=UPI00272D1F21|nr:biopolymer transporter ExbD [Pseudomonas sp.]